MTAQAALFDGMPVKKTNHANSAAAYKSVLDQLPTINAKIKYYLACRGQHGATTEEVETALVGRHQTISAAISRLKRDPGSGVRETATKRLTKSGCKAAVYVFASGEPK